MTQEKDSQFDGEVVKAIPYARQSISEADIQAVVDVLRSDFVTQGPAIERFERGLCEVTGARYAVAVSSGTAALHLSCLGLGLGTEHYGIVPAITFAATANCLRYVGAEVRFCDVDPLSGKASKETLEAAIQNADTKKRLGAVLPVSLSGSAAGLDELAKIARREGAYVIEDAAHSIGAEYRNSEGSVCRSGSCTHSDAAILSFHPVKHICAGEGGAVLTNDEVLARRIRRLRTHGVEKGERWLYDQVELGYHYRMTEMQAALGASQLGRLSENVVRRRDLVERFREAFSEEPFSRRLQMAQQDDGSAWHLFVVHFSGAEEREAAYCFLREQKVFAQVHYFPVYRHSDYGRGGSFQLEGAERYAGSCLSLPLYPSLSDAEQDRVVDVLRAFFER